MSEKEFFNFKKLVREITEKVVEIRKDLDESREENSFRFPSIPDEPFEKPCSVIRPWVHNLSFKQQTVLIVALRGYDSVGKHDPSKPLVKALRFTLLHNADPSKSNFMKFDLPWNKVEDFLEDYSHSYPMHWLMHFIHAAEIIGYKHPESSVRSWWRRLYYRAVEVLHLTPETEDQLDARLGDNF